MHKHHDDKPGIIILNRWSDDFAEYHRHINHEHFDVFYITTAAGLQGIRAEAAKSVCVVDTMDDLDEMVSFIAAVLARGTSLTQLIALSEFDLDLGAELRCRFGIPGPQPSQVKMYRDKVVMKSRLSQRGIRVPRYQTGSDLSDITALLAKVGLPCILKPRVGAASKGVFKIDSIKVLNETLMHIDLNQYECEEYIKGEILHVDGVVIDGIFAFIQASKYINTCLQFNSGVPLGSVFIDEPNLHNRIEDFTNQILQALELSTGAFHLELFLTPDGELVFLEIGARVGGGEIGYLMRDLFGIDLVGLWLTANAGGHIRPMRRPDNQVGGFLLIPEPRDVPFMVTECPSMSGKIPCLYKEIIPRAGQILDGNGGYDVISGRFRYVGMNSREVEAAIRLTMDRFRLKGKRFQPPALSTIPAQKIVTHASAVELSGS